MSPRSAFSLLEVMISGLLLSIVVTAVSLSVVTGTQATQRVSTRGDLDDTANKILKRLANDLRCAVVLANPPNSDTQGGSVLEYRLVNTVDGVFPTYANIVTVKYQTATVNGATVSQLVRIQNGVTEVLSNDLDTQFRGNLTALQLPGVNASLTKGFLASRVANRLTLGLTLFRTIGSVKNSMGQTVDLNVTSSASVVVNLRNGQTTDSVISQNEGYLALLANDEFGGSLFHANNTLPEPPQNLIAASTGSSSGTLTWTDKSNNESGFRIERRIGSNGTFSLYATVSANVQSYSVSGLAPSTAYDFRVCAYNGSGESAYSNVATLGTPSISPPVAPSNVKAVALDYQTIKITWSDNSSNETMFQVYGAFYNPAAGYWMSTMYPYPELATNTTSYVFSAQSGTQYYFYVWAANASGQSSWVYSGYVTTPSAPAGSGPNLPPPPPGNVSATVIDAYSARITWNDNASTETSYQLYQYEYDLAWNYVSSKYVTALPADSTAHVATSLNPDRNYAWYVWSRNSSGDSNWMWSGWVQTPSAPALPPTPPAPPIAPDLANAVVATGGSSQVTVTWRDNSSDESGFIVQRATATGSGKNKTWGGFTTLTTPNAGVTAYVDTTAAKNTSYKYRIAATNGNGTSSWSNEAEAK